MFSSDRDLPAELHFPDGLVGLPDLRRFSVRTLEETAFVVIDSLDDDAFGAIGALADDVRRGMSDDLVTAGHASPGAHVVVLLAVHGDPPTVTANLAGPLVIDPVSGTAAQVVLEGEAYPLRAPLATFG